MYRKIGLMVLVFLIFSSSVFAQTEENTKLPKIGLTLTTKKPDWRIGEKLLVKVVIENLDEKFAIIHDDVSFTINGSGFAISNNAFIICFADSETKSHILMKGEKKKLTFDLADMQWSDLNTPITASRLLEKHLYSFVRLGKCKVKIAMPFHIYRNNGNTITEHEWIKSNETEIEIKTDSEK